MADQTSGSCCWMKLITWLPRRRKEGTKIVARRSIFDKRQSNTPRIVAEFTRIRASVVSGRPPEVWQFGYEKSQPLPVPCAVAEFARIRAGVALHRVRLAAVVAAVARSVAGALK